MQSKLRRFLLFTKALWYVLLFEIGNIEHAKVIIVLCLCVEFEYLQIVMMEILASLWTLYTAMADGEVTMTIPRMFFITFIFKT